MEPDLAIELSCSTPQCRPVSPSLRSPDNGLADICAAGTDNDHSEWLCTSNHNDDGIQLVQVPHPHPLCTVCRVQAKPSLGPRAKGQAEVCKRKYRLMHASEASPRRTPPSSPHPGSGPHPSCPLLQLPTRVSRWSKVQSTVLQWTGVDCKVHKEQSHVLFKLIARPAGRHETYS